MRCAMAARRHAKRSARSAPRRRGCGRGRAVAPPPQPPPGCRGRAPPGSVGRAPRPGGTSPRAGSPRRRAPRRPPAPARPTAARTARGHGRWADRQVATGGHGLRKACSRSAEPRSPTKAARRDPRAGHQPGGVRLDREQDAAGAAGGKPALDLGAVEEGRAVAASDAIRHAPWAQTGTGARRAVRAAGSERSARRGGDTDRPTGRPGGGGRTRPRWRAASARPSAAARRPPAQP